MPLPGLRARARSLTGADAMTMRTFSRKKLLCGCAALLAAGMVAWLGFLYSVTSTSSVVPVVIAEPPASLPPDFQAIRHSDSLQALLQSIEPVPSQPAAQSQPARDAAEAQPPRLQSLEEFVDEVTRNGRLPVQAAASFRQASSDSLRAARQLARASRSVVRTVDGAALIYEFKADPGSAAELRSQIAAAVTPYMAGGSADTLLAFLSEAGEADPSLDMLAHRRQIIISPGDEEDRWQVLDRTYTNNGVVVAANTVFLGIDEEGELVWPEEYLMLLSEHVSADSAAKNVTK